MTLINLSRITLTDNGHSIEQVENILAAVAAAWALGITPELICSGIATAGSEQVGHLSRQADQETQGSYL